MTNNNPRSIDTIQCAPQYSIGPFIKEWAELKTKSHSCKNKVGLIAKGFVQLVDNNYKQEHAVQFYAVKLNITKRYLRKICEQYIGHSPGSCIHIRLMNEACQLLSDPNIEIKVISGDLGFSDSSYFTRFFKKNGRLTPAAYRKILWKVS